MEKKTINNKDYNEIVKIANAISENLLHHFNNVKDTVSMAAGENASAGMLLGCYSFALYITDLIMDKKIKSKEDVFSFLGPLIEKYISDRDEYEKAN